VSAAFCDALLAELALLAALGLLVAGLEPALLEELPVVGWSPPVVEPVEPEPVWAMATDPSNSAAPAPAIKIFFFMTKSPASLMDRLQPAWRNGVPSFARFDRTMARLDNGLGEVRGRWSSLWRAVKAAGRSASAVGRRRGVQC
jgi:hypothetical protein